MIQQGKYKDLDALFALQRKDCEPWIIGRRAKHYKRLTCSDEEAVRLAKLGASQIMAAYGTKLFFTQAVIAGAILSDDYDEACYLKWLKFPLYWLQKTKKKIPFLALKNL